MIKLCLIEDCGQARAQDRICCEGHEQRIVIFDEWMRLDGDQHAATRCIRSGELAFPPETSYFAKAPAGQTLTGFLDDSCGLASHICLDADAVGIWRTVHRLCHIPQGETIMLTNDGSFWRKARVLGPTGA